MKRIILITFSLVLALTMSAQEKIDGFYCQPKAGMTVATITNVSNNDPRIGMVFGAELEYESENILGMAIGLHYSMQGDKASGYVNGYGHTTVVEKLDYLNIPILGVLHVADGFSLKVGVQPGFNVLARIRATAGSISEETSFRKLGVNTNTFDFSVPFGLSYTFKGGLTLEGRYNLGISEIVTRTDMKNSVFQFTIGYRAKL